MKRYFQETTRNNIHRSLEQLKTPTTNLQRAWTFLGTDMFSVPEGYVMFESNETGRDLEWLHSLLDWMILYGIVHGDLKPANVYKGGLIDWDNILYQCTGFRQLCMCDTTHYDLKRHSIAGNEIRNALSMVGAEGNWFFMYVAANYLYVLSLRAIDVNCLLGKDVLGFSVNDVKEKRVPPWTSDAKHPWPSSRDLAAYTVCRVEMSRRVQDIYSDETCAPSMRGISFPHFGGVRMEYCDVVFRTYCEVSGLRVDATEEVRTTHRDDDDDDTTYYYSLASGESTAPHDDDASCSYSLVDDVEDDIA